MVGTGVDLKMAQEVAGEAVAGEHASDGQLDDSAGLALEHIAEGGLLEPAHIAGVAVVYLIVELLAGYADLLRVDDDYEVSHVQVGGVGRLMLAHQ